MKAAFFALLRLFYSTVPRDRTNCSYTQKADENVALQKKASPSRATQFLTNDREKKHLMQVHLAEDLKGEPRTLRAWKDGVRSRRRSQRDERCR